MDFGNVAIDANDITVEFRVSQFSLRSRKEDNHFDYSLASEKIMSSLMSWIMSRIMSCKKDRMALVTGHSLQNVRT